MSDDVKINRYEIKYNKHAAVVDSLSKVLTIKENEFNKWRNEHLKEIEDSDTNLFSKAFTKSLFLEPDYIESNPQFIEIKNLKKKIEREKGGMGSAIRMNQRTKYRKDYKKYEKENPNLSKEEIELILQKEFPNFSNKKFSDEDWYNLVDYEFKKGGKINGPSHDNGGVHIEAEGGEIIINKNINNAAGKHENNLLNLNNNPDDYKIVRDDDNSYKWPSNDARKRGE